MGRHLVVAVLALGLSAGCGGEDSTKLKDQPGYEDAHRDAELYCTLAGVVGPNGPDSLYDPEYLACVKVETKRNLEEEGP